MELPSLCEDTGTLYPFNFQLLLSALNITNILQPFQLDYCITRDILYWMSENVEYLWFNYIFAAFSKKGVPRTYRVTAPVEKRSLVPGLSALSRLNIHDEGMKLIRKYENMLYDQKNDYLFINHLLVIQLTTFSIIQDKGHQIVWIVITLTMVKAVHLATNLVLSMSLKIQHQVLLELYHSIPWYID